GLTEAKSLYFVMELLEGRSLRSILLKRGKLRWQDALPLFAKIAEGVHAAHARSVIHRDLKPENIFVLKDGTPKVLDFGIAKFVDAPPLTTREHVFHGTPPYMSPEQLSGRQVTYQSDVYALGIVLWEVLVGTHPMMSADGDNDPNSVAYRHIYSHPPLVSELEPSVGKPIARLVNRMISKVPAQRPASMPEVAKELMRCYEKCSSVRRGFFGAITTGRVRVKAAAELKASKERPWFDDGSPAAADQAPVAAPASRASVAPSAIAQQRPLDAHAPSREQAPSEPLAQREPAEVAANAAEAVDAADDAAEQLKLKVGFTQEFSTKLLSQLRLRPSTTASHNAKAAPSNPALSNTARPQDRKSSVVPAREGKFRSLVLQLLVLAVGGLSLGGALVVLAMHLKHGRTKQDVTVRAPTVNALPSAPVVATHSVLTQPTSVASVTPSAASSVTPSVTAPAARAVAKTKPKASNADRFLKALEAELAQRKAAKAAAKQQLPSTDKLLFTPQPEPKAGSGQRASKQNARPTTHVGAP
ncbi:MAG TPA: serine/threonine-protein kinase, partial [Polyangiaceae bacterium]|nr:serine/threonine-protein kinase [Polyangiaceae bacterium]